MIPVVAEIAAAAQGELRASESQRKIAPSVDKFAEHLRKPNSPHRSEQESSVKSKAKHQAHEKKQASPSYRQETRPDGEPRASTGQKTADAKDVDANSDLVDNTEEESSEPKDDASTTNAAGQVCLVTAPETVPFHVDDQRRLAAS